jgi:hypothetical protein
MTVRIERVTASASLEIVTRMLAELALNKLPSLGLLKHLAGKMIWYSEVLHGGPCHTQSLFILQVYYSRPSPSLLQHFQSDLEWWSQVLTTWTSGDSSSAEYPIINGHTLASDPSTITILRSDASGTDGFGYFSGSLTSTSFRYYSATWSSAVVYSTSHNAELQALLHYMAHTIPSGQLLLWVTDSLAAAWSLNKRRSHEEISLPLLQSVFERADALRVFLVALWVPREQNCLSDYLSHFAADCLRAECEGTLPPHTPLYSATS